MAWRRRPGHGTPERLARFVASEWPGACPHEALDAWRAACLAWVADHPDSLPFGQYGGWLDVLREARRYRRAMTPCPGKA